MIGNGQDNNVRIKTENNDWAELGFGLNGLISFAGKDYGWVGNERGINAVINMESLKEIKPPDKFGDISAVYCIAEGSGALLSESGEITLTEDSGRGWKRVNIEAEGAEINFSMPFVSLCFTDMEHGLVIAFDRARKAWVSLATVDGGASWNSEYILEGHFGKPTLSRNAAFLTINTVFEPFQVLVFELKK